MHSTFVTNIYLILPNHLKQFAIRNWLSLAEREASYAIMFCNGEKLRAVSPLGGVGFRPVKVANPEGGGGV
jgi:hypothetical protein